MRIGNHLIGDDHPVYFIADIAANYDGSLSRARDLIHLAAESGADCAKFQTFNADSIVSREGFDGLKVAHQSSWSKPVYDVYKDASMPREWIPELAEECRRAGVEFMSTPYDYSAVHLLAPYVSAYKIGSGDVTWLSLLRYVANIGKPVILSTGASDIGEVERAVRMVMESNDFCGDLVLMQCNTNYTGEEENLRHINLRVLQTYNQLWPDAVLGLSDHTPGHSAILGAVAMGARVIEKHFTDDNSREGPDHHFAMTPSTWREMVDRTRELEMALGSPVKRVCDNERETVIVQRRSIRATRTINAGEVIHEHDVAYLRPCPADAIPASEDITGRRAQRVIPRGEAIRWGDLE